MKWTDNSSCVCACSFCKEPAALPHLYCALCHKHCPLTPYLHGELAPFEQIMAETFFSMMRWRVHQIRSVLEDCEVDVPALLGLAIRGELTRTIKLLDAAHELDNQYESHMRDTDEVW